MGYDVLAASIEVLDFGLPRPPDVLSPGESAPVARWQHSGFGAVLHLRRRMDGDRDLDLAVLWLDVGTWRFASGYEGWQERSALLERNVGWIRRTGPVEHVGTTVHRPRGGSAPDMAVVIGEFVAAPEVASIRVDYPEGPQEWPVRPPGMVLIGHTGVEPNLTPLDADGKVIY